MQAEEDNNQDGVQQGGTDTDQSEQDNADDTMLEGETRLTSPSELTPSPTSQDFLGRGSPQVQDNTLDGGGSNIIARDCPDKGPIPPDCTLNPFPPTPPKCPDKGPIHPDCTLNPFPLLQGDETQREVTPTPNILATPLTSPEQETSLLTPAPPLFGQISPDKNLPTLQGNLQVGDTDPSNTGTTGGGVGNDKGR
jgi:hypothetical protein